MKQVSRLSAVLWVGVLSGLGTPAIASSAVYEGSSFSAAPISPTPARLEIAQSSASLPVPRLPVLIPDPFAPLLDGIVDLDPSDPSAEMGIGHLRPKDLSFLDAPDWTSSPYLAANWLGAAAIPIYAEPNGPHWGWIVNGWLIPNGQPPIAIGRDATFLMVQTYYALLSFPVMEIREDGWFQVQYTPAGTAWVHVDHLNLGDMELTFERWEDRFLEMGWVQYRAHGLSQPLRAVPGLEQEMIGLIGPDSFIEPLAFEGDWMRVRVTQPTDGCTFLPAARTQEGWMRWRDDDGRSLVWFPPKGC